MAMTPNPALLLHARLKAWSVTPPNVTVLDHRAIEERSWHSVHLETLEWVLAVRRHMETEAALEGDEETEDIDALIDACLRAVFFLEDAMNVPRPSSRIHISGEVLRHLRTVGRSWKSPEVSPQWQASLLGTAQEAQALVLASTHLDDEARLYLNQITSHLIKAVGDIEIGGVETVRNLANELAGALAVYFADQEDSQEAKGIISKLVGQIKSLFFRQYVPTAITAGTEAVIQHALTAGSP